MKFHLEQASVGHIEAIKDFHGLLHKEIKEDATLSEDDLRSYVFEPEAKILVASTTQDVPIGFIISKYSLEQTEIINLFVLEEYRKKQVGSYLVEMIKRWSTAKKCKELIVKHTHAKEFYLKQGFKDVEGTLVCSIN